MWPFPDLNLWYLQPKSTLSNVSAQDNTKLHEACDFICKVSKKLNFPYRTTATALLYFQLLFVKDSFESYPHMDIALTSLLVASKAEETYKKIRQILAAAFLILSPDFKGTELDVKIVEEHRQRVTQYEHIVLESIEYNFTIRHVFEVLAEICKSLKVDDKAALRAFSKSHKLYYSPLVLCYTPECLALTCILEALNIDLNSKSSEINKLMKCLHIHNEDVKEAVQKIKTL